MALLRNETLSLSVLFIIGCTPATPQAPPPPKTVFDPLTQQLERARDVQKAVDQHTEDTRRAVEGQERGDPPP